jgi:hypothetical protein
MKSRILRWTGHVVRMGSRRGAYRVLVGKPEGKRPLGKLRRRWEDNIKMNFFYKVFMKFIKMDLREVRWGGMDWIDLAQDRDRWRALVSAVVNVWFP